MKVEFVLRTPGEHMSFVTVEMDSVPREGEQVSLDGDTNGTVHSVVWDIPAKRAIVLVRK